MATESNEQRTTDNAGGSNENGYRSILKGTSILGGVQLFQILINLVRGKFVAMLLGPEGMGIAAIFTSTQNTLVRFSSLGLDLAFVKEAAASRGRPDRLHSVIMVALQIIRLTALGGAVICALASPLLSRIAFGDYSCTWQFLLLSVAVYLTLAANGKLALLQGLHEVKRLSRVSLIGAATGLLAGVPLYYFFGNKGIVPAIIVLALAIFIFYTLGLRKAHRQPRTAVSHRFRSKLTRKMLQTGVILLASALVNTICTYLINIFISNYGNLSDVGLFNAANGITLQYAGIVFAAMALDYFPRLAAAAKAADASLMRSIINRQMVTVALIVTPLCILLIATAPLIIRILLTDEFLPVRGLLCWLGVSVLFKAIAYPLGYVAIAKDNRRLFFWLEAVACNALYLGMSLIFYALCGLDGLGYGAVAEQAVCVILYLCVNRAAFGFTPDRRAVGETLLAICLGCSAFAATMLTSGATAITLLVAIALASVSWTVVRLRKLLAAERIKTDGSQAE